MVVGAEVLNFQLLNDEAEPIDFYEALDKTEKGIAIFVYPKANTTGCSKQACGFRDHYDEIKACGYDVIGISKDKPTSQASWKKAKNLPYNLLSDEEGEVLKSLGCLSGSSTTRSVFVVGKESRQLIVDHVKISPDESVAAVIKAIKKNPESSGEDSHDEIVAEVDEPTPEEPKADAKLAKSVKPKGKAKASPAARSASKRSASVDASSSSLEKKAPGRSTPGKKLSVKRAEPSGVADGADDEEDSPKGAKRPRKTPPTPSTNDSSSARTGSARVRTASQPATATTGAASRTRASTRTASKDSEKTAKKAATKELKETKESKTKPKRVGGGSSTGRVGSGAAAPPKKSKKA